MVRRVSPSNGELLGEVCRTFVDSMMGWYRRHMTALGIRGGKSGAVTVFVVRGGHAVAFHGHPRATKDLDILVHATRENAARVYQALAAFGAPLQAFDVSGAEPWTSPTSRDVGRGRGTS